MNEIIDDNQSIIRGNKFNEYNIKEPVDQEYYTGEIWNPKQSETLTGIFVECLDDVGKYHQKMYVIDTDRLDGKYDKIFGCTSLDRQMNEIKKGSVIEIKYLGKNSEKGYHEYRISRLRKNI